MTRTWKAISLAAGFGIVAGLLGGCADNPLGAQEQGEISAESSGQMVVAMMSETDTLGATLETSASAFDHMNMSMESEFGLTTGLALGMQGLAKRRGSQEPFAIDYSDTAHGVLRLVFFSEGFGTERFDTLAVRWDDAAKDDIEDNENVISLSGKEVTARKTSSYRITDLDGDGVVAGSDSYTGSARFLHRTIRENGIIEELTIDVDAGADHDFDSEDDNLLVAIDWVQTSGSDTVGYAQFTDADNDGKLVVTGTPSVVDVDLYDKDPVLRPRIEYSHLKLRIITDGNEANDKVVALSGEEKRRSGRISTVAAVDEDGDSEITEGERATVTFETRSSPSGDPVRRARAVFVYDVGEGLQKEDDNRFSEIHLNQDLRVGFVRNRSFDFTTEEPFLDGREPTSGHVEMSVTYSDGSQATIVADFDATGFSGTWTDPEGNVSTVQWDHSGSVVSSTEG